MPRWTYLCVTVLVIMVGVPVLATGQYYSSRYSSQPYYSSTPHYSSTPSYSPPPSPPSYEPPYETPVQKVVANEINVAPLIVTIPVEAKRVPVSAYGAPYYYNVGQAYQEKAYLREVLREELRNLIGTANAVKAPTATYNTTTTSTTVTGSAASVTGATGVAVGGGGGAAGVVAPVAGAVAGAAGLRAAAAVADTVTPDDLQNEILHIYQGKGNCISCHGAEATASGMGGIPFHLVVDAGGGKLKLAKQNSDKRWKIYGMASSGAMPPAAASDANKGVEVDRLPVLLKYAMLKQD